MAAPQITYVVFLILTVKRAKAPTISSKVLDIDEKKYNIKSHLENANVTLACRTRDSICKSDDTNLCAVRLINGSKVYKDYTNWCFLFMSNMCDNPGEEFLILSSGTCSNYLASRRQEDTDNNTATENGNSFTETTIDSAVESVSENADNDTTADPTATEYTKSPVLRQKTVKTLPTLYAIKYAYDWHRCPRSCPNLYKPQCLNVNRGKGKYFKFFQFVNHCAADMFYCSHPAAFDPPESQGERAIQTSYLPWNFCGSAKYLQFARFVEVASSLAHYGWLRGDFSARHIMKPHERVPGYG